MNVMKKSSKVKMFLADIKFSLSCTGVEYYDISVKKFYGQKNTNYWERIRETLKCIYTFFPFS